MDIRHVQYFLKVAETGNFTAAADALYISQSSLSKQIQALERELDVTLFDRSRRRIALTPAGELFRRHAHNLQAAYLSTLADLAEFRSGPSFSVVSIPVIAPYGIPARLSGFRAAYPHLDFTLEEQEAAQILAALDGGRHEVAFVRQPFVDAARYSWAQVAADRLAVAVSRSHPLAGRASVALQELAREPLIVPGKGSLVHDLAVDACRAAGFEPRIVYTSLRAASILGLAATGNGVALMMERILGFTAHPDVVALPLAEPVEANVVLAWRADRRLSPAARAFVEFMAAERSK